MSDDYLARERALAAQRRKVVFPVTKQLFFPIIFFLIISFIAMIYLDSSVRASFNDTLSHQGGMVGPFSVTTDSSTCLINVKRLRDLPAGSWDALDLEIIDEQQNTVVAFGGELWFEKGVEEGERWQEKVYDIELKYYCDEPGNYYLKLSAVASEPIEHAKMYHIQFKQLRANADFMLRFFILLIILLIVNFVLFMRSSSGK